MNHIDHDIEAAITQALQARREPRVPADFATRVRASLPPLPRRCRRFSYSLAGILAMAVLAALSAFVLAAHSPARFSSVAFDAECFFTLLAVVLAGWTARHEAV